MKKRFARLLKNNFLVCHWKKRQLERIKYFVGGKFDSVLNIGCNDLESNDFFECEFFIGLDIDKTAIQDAVKNKKVCFVVGDAHDLPFKDKCFSLVFEKDVLHHLKEPREAVGEMLRVSKSAVKIVEGRRGNVFGDYWVKQGHEHFSDKDFAELVGKEHSQFLALPFLFINSRKGLRRYNLLSVLMIIAMLLHLDYKIEDYLEKKMPFFNYCEILV
jgi:ubiquinone/menaquinone biosynthesis C-methylase UbiE